MKSPILDKTGKEKGSIDIPNNFSNQIRQDILLKVFEAQKYKQPMGTKPFAGMMYSASGILRHKRHAWKVTYGKGISRVPRKIMSRHGANFNWVGATIASTRGGRRSHPPKTEENQFKKINKKEFLIAINSAFSGTSSKATIEKRYSKQINAKLPIVFDSSILSLKTKEFFLVLKNVLGELYENALKKKSIRAGRGKLRGRKYKSNAGLLFVIGSDEKMKRKGIEIVNAKDLRVKDLAPNAIAGRITFYTEKAIKEIPERFK